MSKPTYWELLRRPEWQRKRLEIMERDDFACIDCGAKDKTLNVHHGYYKKDAMPWDYENETLHTLCESCHEVRHHVIDEISKATAHLSAFYLSRLHGYVMMSLVAQSYIYESESNISDDLKVYGIPHAIGIAGAWGVHHDEFIKHFPIGSSVTFAAVTAVDWQSLAVYAPPELIEQTAEG